MGVGGINSWDVKALPVNKFRLNENTYQFEYFIYPVK
jgi:hypothetical protein